MRLNVTRSNRRRAIWNGAFALLSLAVSFVLGAVVRLPREFLWIFPFAGIIGYLIFSREAIRAWRPEIDRTWRAPVRGRYPHRVSSGPGVADEDSREESTSESTTSQTPARGQ